MTVQRPDWGPKTDGPRETPGQASVRPTPASDERHVKPAAEDLAHDDADLDDSALHRKLLADGVMTPEELGEHYGLDQEQLDALSKPARKPLSRQSVDKELAAIAEYRRRDRRGYFKDEAKQARERELIGLREGLKAQPVAAETGSKPDNQGDASTLDPALLKEWEGTSGVKYALQTAQRTAQAVLDALEGDDRQQLETGFDGLPTAAQTEIVRYLALEPSGVVRPANNADLERFAGTPEGSELIRDWGRDAPRRVAIVRNRMESMLRQMPETDRAAALAWFDRLSSQQSKAVYRALAGR